LNFTDFFFFGFRVLFDFFTLLGFLSGGDLVELKPGEKSMENFYFAFSISSKIIGLHA
jgi:hypothetical protein